MPISPDVKDWTWVLARPCPECQFDASVTSPGDVSTIIRSNASTWMSVLGRSNVARRPDDSTWSPGEYAAHVRDVLRIAALRLALMVSTDSPVFVDWNQDQTAIQERYFEQDPATVGKELLLAAAGLAGALDELAPDDWSLTGRRSDGAFFTVAAFAKYIAHDVEHHRNDVRG